MPVAPQGNICRWSATNWIASKLARQLVEMPGLPGRQSISTDLKMLYEATAVPDWMGSAPNMVVGSFGSATVR
ncbi:MAG: hypothetical protein JWO25_771, partial [Alphaproteobacteria bacterium]|nr:hypothetical protein [Alphaproteobacteria bacterium]